SAESAAASAASSAAFDLPRTATRRSLGRAATLPSSRPAARRKSRLPGVAITAEACSTPGSLPSDAESSISETESRYRFGSSRWMYTGLYTNTRVCFRGAARDRPARPFFTRETISLRRAAAFADRRRNPAAHRAPRRRPDLDPSAAARGAGGPRRRARARRPQDLAALRHPVRDQGQHRRRGASDDGRLLQIQLFA